MFIYSHVLKQERSSGIISSSCASTSKMGMLYFLQELIFISSNCGAVHSNICIEKLALCIILVEGMCEHFNDGYFGGDSACFDWIVIDCIVCAMAVLIGSA